MTNTKIEQFVAKTADEHGIKKFYYDINCSSYYFDFWESELTPTSFIVALIRAYNTDINPEDFSLSELLEYISSLTVSLQRAYKSTIIVLSTASQD